MYWTILKVGIDAGGDN